MTCNIESKVHEVGRAKKVLNKLVTSKLILAARIAQLFLLKDPRKILGLHGFKEWPSCFPIFGSPSDLVSTTQECRQDLQLQVIYCIVRSMWNPQLA